MVREPMSAEVGRECFVERPMLRKLLSVALLALGMGLGGRAPRRRERAMRVVHRFEFAPCPRIVVGTSSINSSVRRFSRTCRRPFMRRSRSRACGPSARRSCSRGPSRRSAMWSSSTSAKRRTRSSGPSIARCSREVQYTVQRPVTRTVWKDVTVHGRTARCARLTTRTESYTVCRPVRETTLKTCVYNVSRPVREVGTRTYATRSAGRCRRPSSKTVNYTVCRPVQETCYKTCAYTVCRPVQKRCGRVASRTPCRSRSSTP